MNPSYNDSFGSFGSGSPMSPGPIVSGSVAPEPMRSGAGDRKKWWVFLIVILIFVAVGGGVFALWKGGVFGGGGSDNSASVNREEIESVFNGYANYILLGKSDNGTLTRQTIEDAVPYFETLSNSGEINQYVAQASQKYDDFVAVYYGDFGNDDLYAIKNYYQDFPMVKVLSETEILEIYLKGGENVAEELINEMYGTVGINQYLEGYLDALRNYAEMWLRTFVKMNNAGCISTEGCYEMPEEDEKELADGITKINVIKEKMQVDAQNALLRVYDEIYNGEELE